MTLLHVRRCECQPQSKVASHRHQPRVGPTRLTTETYIPPSRRGGPRPQKPWSSGLESLILTFLEGCHSGCGSVSQPRIHTQVGGVLSRAMLGLLDDSTEYRMNTLEPLILAGCPRQAHSFKLCLSKRVYMSQGCEKTLRPAGKKQK